MITPIVIATKLHSGLDLAPFTAQVIEAHYQVDGISFSSKLKLWRGVDDIRLVHCPACGCPVRQLTHHPDRPGLLCIDCLSRYEHALSAKLPAKRSKKLPAPAKDHPWTNPRSKVAKKSSSITRKARQPKIDQRRKAA